MSKILFGFVVFALCLSVSNARLHKRFTGQCPLQKRLSIAQCMEPMNDFALSLQQHEADAGNDSKSPMSLPILQKQAFKKICKLFSEYETCVGPHVSDCPKDLSITLLNSTYGYICKDGYDTYLENAECFYSVETIPSVKKCKKTLISETVDLALDFSVSPQDKMDQTCSNINKYIDCTRSPIKEQCGLKAWSLIHKVIKDVLNGLMPTCEVKVQKQRKYVVERKPKEIYLF
uniref:DUF19 domain-containing protein n=1 Tax=Panagrolaimus sp. JU765 TaxID=591449 RepID=A0AC34QII3_9BILA